MPDGSATLTLTLHKHIAEIPAADWNACAGADKSREFDTCQHVCDERGGAGVADADLAITDDADVLVPKPCIDGASCFER